MKRITIVGLLVLSACAPTQIDCDDYITRVSNERLGLAPTELTDDNQAQLEQILAGDASGLSLKHIIDARDQAREERAQLCG